jgi:hypothetical protein
MINDEMLFLEATARWQHKSLPLKNDAAVCKHSGKSRVVRKSIVFFPNLGPQINQRQNFDAGKAQRHRSSYGQQRERRRGGRFHAVGRRYLHRCRRYDPDDSLTNSFKCNTSLHFITEEGDHVLAENSDDDSSPENEMKGPGQPLREQDRFLPIANVAKIMKRAIPETGKVCKFSQKL